MYNMYRNFAYLFLIKSRFEQQRAPVPILFVQSVASKVESSFRISGPFRRVSDPASDSSPLPCNVKSEETRCALRAASSLRPTLPDFHRAKSSVAYHTSGRHADLTCRESRLIVIVLLARGSAPCSSARGAPPDGKGAARHVLHMDGRSPSPLDHRQSVDRVSPSVLFLVAVAVRSSPVSSFTSSSSFIKTNPESFPLLPRSFLPLRAARMRHCVSNFRGCPSVHQCTRVHRGKIKEGGGRSDEG